MEASALWCKLRQATSVSVRQTLQGTIALLVSISRMYFEANQFNQIWFISKALLEDGVLQFRNSGNLRDYVLKENALNASLTEVKFN